MEIFSISLNNEYRLVFHYLYETGITNIDVVKFENEPIFMNINDAPVFIKNKIKEITKLL